MSRPLIEVQQVSVSRTGTTVLTDINFSIAQRDCVAIVGPNGAGKSTLMLAMLGLLPVNQGRISLLGRSLNRFGGRKSIAREIAYVAQQYEGFAGFTVEDMVATGRYAYQWALALHSPSDRRIIDEALEACDLLPLRNRIVSSLSGGERQKVFLAAALAQQSPVLFLDEPTSSLDPKHQAELLSLLRRLHEQGKTLVVICHDINLALVLDARVLALQTGRLLFDEPIKKFVEDDHLQQVFDTQFQRLTGESGGVRVLPAI